MGVSGRQYRRLLRVYLAPHWPWVSLLVAALAVTLALSLINPLIISHFIDRVAAGAALSELLWLAVLFLGASILKQLVSVGESYVAGNVGLRATNTMRADLLAHCLELDPTFHAEHTPGELIERVDGDVENLANFFSRFLVSMTGNGLLLLGVLVMFYRIDWRVGLVLTLTSAIWIGGVAAMRTVSTRTWKQSRQADAEVYGFLEERIGGLEDVRSSGATAYMLRGLALCTEKARHLLMRAFRLGYFARRGMILLSSLQVALALALAAWLFFSHDITLGTVYLIFNYTTLMHAPVEFITSQLQDWQQMSGSVVRILALLDTRGRIRDGIGRELPAGPLSVEFDDVSFRYSEEVPVLQHVSFSLAPGEILGLLGRTGSGKSTLVRLLVRLYDPGCANTEEGEDAGMVCLGGIDLRDLTLDDVRGNIGMVTQEVQILHATVRENVTLFNPEIDDVRILAALDALGLRRWYEDLPEGLDTMMAAGGGGLSAGEAQLLAFARVFLKDPHVVILDEASSRLDLATERLLERAIDRLLAGRTAIIIAHRLATVQRADTIMLLEQGRCLEYGRREQLASDPGSRYAHLLRIGLEEVLA